LNGWNYTLKGNLGNVPNGTNIISAPITGSGNFAVSSDFQNGVTILSASNTYVGTTTISGGILRLGASGVIPDASTVTVASTLDLNGYSEAINGLSGAGGVDTIAGGTVTLTVGVSNATSTFTGVIQSPAGSLALVKTGTGTLTLQGSNTFTGGVTIKNGTLESKTTQFTLGTGTVVMGGPGSSGATFITGQPNTNAFTINAPDSGTITIGANGTGSGFTLFGPVTLNGDLVLQNFTNATNNNKTVANLAGGVTGAGNLLLNNLGANTNTITLSGNPVNPTGSITAQGASIGSTTISSVIGANVTGVTQNSATCPLILSATNTYTGPTTVNAGTLVIQVASLAASSTVSVAQGATLQLDFPETNSVAGFSTNGVALPNGVYNAGNVGPFIAGTGSLLVGVAGPSGPATLTNSYSGGVLTLSWPAGQSWRLLQQTNSRSVGLRTNWVDITPGSANSTNITVDKSIPTTFYRLAYP
jgi:autotransporter family porin